MNKKTLQHPRSGVLIICVLVCIGIATSMMSLSTVGALRARRAMKQTHQLRQTEYLLDAGILRAATQLKNSDQYRGEQWEPKIEQLRRLYPRVTISTQAGDERNVFKVMVVATLGGEDVENFNARPFVTKRTYQFNYQRNNSQPSNENIGAE